MVYVLGTVVVGLILIAAFPTVSEFGRRAKEYFKSNFK